MKKRKPEFPVKIAVLLVIALLALSAGTWFALRFFTHAQYFKIREVFTKEPGVDLSYLKGRNIFGVDLKREARYFLRQKPDCSEVRFIRLLPDKVFVDFIRRIPLALVRLNRYLAVDANAVLFNSALLPQDGTLPVITGLERKISSPVPGAKYTNRELLLALSLIREMRRNNVFKEYRIRKIDVDNPESIALFISIPVQGQPPSAGFAPDDLEVKLSGQNLKERVVFLGGLFIAYKQELENIKYIDLRFKDPTIKNRDDKR
ncbi:MAG: cell division protein FtsQ [Candidatus Omnitrophica bacterium]|nr:cell division protein FtsQ [Candidatus Omnitrophota bacterium]